MYQDIFKAYPQLGSKIMINGKKGQLNFINIFSDKGQIRFEDGTQECFTPEDIRKGTVEHVA